MRVLKLWVWSARSDGLPAKTLSPQHPSQLKLQEAKLSTWRVRAEVRRRLEVRIDTLPDAFRTVFMLRAVEELSVEEVAAAWIRTRSHRGHCKAHAALLSKTVPKLGDKPVLAKANYNFPADQLKSQAVTTF